MEMSIGVLQEQSLAQSVCAHTCVCTCVCEYTIGPLSSKETLFQILGRQITFLLPLKAFRVIHCGWMDSFPLTIRHIAGTFTIS